MKSIQCRLCRQPHQRPAKSHIFPKAFFRDLPQKGRVDTMETSGVRGRRLQSAIYDANILCDHCERSVMAPLDSYATIVIRDKYAAFRVEIPERSDIGIWVFNKVEKRTIRAFVASVLWRSSVSNQLEFRSFSVGSSYEELIRRDLLRNGDFEYIDVVLRYLTGWIHGAILLPHMMPLPPVNRCRDTRDVNGCDLQLPNVNISVSLDDRAHPQRCFLSLDPALTGEGTNLLVSTSLNPEADGFKFMAFEAARAPSIAAVITGAVRAASGPASHRFAIRPREPTTEVEALKGGSDHTDRTPSRSE